MKEQPFLATRMLRRRKAQDLYGCPVDGGAIVLDLQSEKYYALRPADTSVKADAAFLRSNGIMVQRDLINLEKLKPLEPDLTETPVTARHLLAFALSVVTVLIISRIGGTKAAISHLARQKSGTGDPSDKTPGADMYGTLQVFLRLRPWFYSARDHCLFDSLILATYLIRMDENPRIVFGVRTQPFGAHAWVQSGDFVIGDLPDRVKLFTPIFVL